MDWETVLAEVIATLAKLLIAVCIPYAMKLLKDKINNDKVNKYIDKAQNVIIQCVDYVNQTYVDALKEEGKFGKEAQHTAFEMSKDYVYKLLDEKAKEAVVEIFGDFELWVDSMIESSVRNSINHAFTLPLVEEGVVMGDGN